MPEGIHDKLDRNAKELAGIILLPRYPFINRAIEIREGLYKTFGYTSTKLADEQKSEIRGSIIRVLMDDFNMNSKPCEIRLERIERYFKQSLYDMVLMPQYLKRRRE